MDIGEYNALPLETEVWFKPPYFKYRMPGVVKRRDGIRGVLVNFLGDGQCFFSEESGGDIHSYCAKKAWEENPIRTGLHSNMTVEAYDGGIIDDVCPSVVDLNGLEIPKTLIPFVWNDTTDMVPEIMDHVLAEAWGKVKSSVFFTIDSELYHLLPRRRIKLMLDIKKESYIYRSDLRNSDGRISINGRTFTLDDPPCIRVVHKARLTGICMVPNYIFTAEPCPVTK